MMVGEKVVLRPFEEKHLQTYLEWVNEPAIASAVTRSLPVTMAEHRRWYESAIARQDTVIFAVTDKSGEYLGNVWLWGIHWVHRNAELRILLGRPKSSGQGYGAEAAGLLVKYAFTRLNLEKVFLYVLESNTPARKVFEKAGFVEEGRLRREFFVEGAYQDALRMAVLRPSP